MTVKNIASAFRITGVFPFNPKAVAVVDTKKGESAHIAEESGPFFPLLSPAHPPKKTLGYNMQNELQIKVLDCLTPAC